MQMYYGIAFQAIPVSVVKYITIHRFCIYSQITYGESLKQDSKRVQIVLQIIRSYA